MNQLHAYCYRHSKANTENYRASSLMRFAHISKNSIVWLPGRGKESPLAESTEDVSEDAKEPSDPLTDASALASPPSPSFFRKAR